MMASNSTGGVKQILGRVVCLIGGHTYSRYEYYEDDFLHIDWGHYHCGRCGDGGLMEHPAQEASNDAE